MIDKLIESSLRNRFLVIAFCVAVAVWGIWALQRTPIDAIPDLSENQVTVFTDWPGRSPQEVEDQITYPLTVNLQGLAGVKTVRSSSGFGFSMVNVIFEDRVGLYFARTRVLERLNLAANFLPAGVVPTLGPDATGVGQVFWYTVEGEGYNLGQLRSTQDWFIRYQLNSVPGVAEVATVGGFVRQYQVDVDPRKLYVSDVSVKDVFEAIMRSNKNVGGKVIEAQGAEYIIRGVGLIQSIKDVEDTVVTSRDGVPIYVKNVATVQLGPDFRRGVLDKGGREAVGGVVIIRYGVNPLEVIEQVKKKIEEIAPGLPQGVRIVPFYDRTGLIEETVRTLKRALVEETVLVALISLVFLLHFRSFLIVTTPLPLAILVAFLFTYYMGISSNIMSLGGIAIAIGVLVDAGIVVAENTFRELSERNVNFKDKKAVLDTVMAATKMVGRPIFFSMVIITLAFVPVFALTGREGKLFHPLAFTKTFAMVGATILSVTLVPVLCSLFLRGKLRPEEKNPVMRLLTVIYEPSLRWALRHKKTVMALASAITIGSLAVIPRIGSEFMPPLEEGSILFMPILSPAVSLNQAHEVLRKQNMILKSFPEVEMVVGKVGRAETATDPAPVNMTETIVTLKPKTAWRKGLTKEDLINEMDAALRIPGVTNIWTQPIINRIDMLSTGIRTPLGVKLFGSDLRLLEEKAKEVADAVRTVRGAADVYPEKILGAPYLEIVVKRAEAARYGISVGDIEDMVEMAVGGENLTMTIEGRQRFPVRVRYARELRDNMEAIKRVLVKASNGAQLPLAQLVEFRIAIGPSMISSENGLLQALVLMNVRGRDLGSFVEEAKKVVAEQVKVPTGYFLKWSGQYEDQLRAKQRLQLVVPAVILIIFILLYVTYNSWKEALLVILSLPFALVGGLLFLYLTGYNFSVAVWVGFIALFGTAVETGVIMLIYLREAFDRLGRDDPEGAVMEGAVQRLRPKMMTVSAIIFGLVPLMWSTETGSEVMRPLATPVIGGMISSTILVLIVLPVLYLWMKEWELSQARASSTTEA
ncbi:MAG: CzcA family heavy metal efflux protein, Cu(I)/Ag(I) efflux system membrane protein CusA [candidate division NC10 bacterium CSP1-5]|nr:MAG: CzcA family heavy metal efflux protein, Cu(I)/Ag(I) efflux system membrane protein CusA [candidate division NC10 bacterium CSP1-5]